MLATVMSFCVSNRIIKLYYDLLVNSQFISAEFGKHIGLSVDKILKIKVATLRN